MAVVVISGVDRAITSDDLALLTTPLVSVQSYEDTVTLDFGDATPTEAEVDALATALGGMSPTQEAEHEETKSRIALIVDELQAEKARVQPAIDASNATINANPAGYIKDNARAAKRIADAAIDLAKYVDGR